MNQRKWVEPTLFEPEAVQYDVLHLRVDAFLNGPRNSLETWCTITDRTGGWVDCRGGERALLLPHGRDITTELAGQLFDATMRRLQPF